MLKKILVGKEKKFFYLFFVIVFLYTKSIWIALKQNLVKFKYT